MKFLVPAAAALVLAAPAFAANEATNPQTAAKESDDPNRMICKKQKTTGSRMGSKKICMTAAQWRQLEFDQRQATERAQNERQTQY